MSTERVEPGDRLEIALQEYRESYIRLERVFTEGFERLEKRFTEFNSYYREVINRPNRKSDMQCEVIDFQIVKLDAQIKLLKSRRRA
ncbi:hypothetical protein EV586_11321 [Tumebacillus sp. BK434]|uniref:hypothetical protein n=1 Tax=Tumebacillus sp. BK434 TaxID=2512169 RepID=UPI0010503905|nr:hypothetical protein [Tumebacillus sp. BK434]TCP52212.1 hypothetical protein EV586_11321 [Tumebacillus sp. BK434]